jgi:parallel beta-helix repeat protein
MRRRFAIYSLVIVIPLFFSMSYIQVGTSNTWKITEFDAEQSSTKHLAAFAPHAPITIIGNQNFTDTALAEGWPGDGSSQDPFIIDGLDIDRGSVAGHCISIYNTRVNFTISNCSLTGATVSPGAGIFLHNVSHAEITNNNCSANRYGISLDSRSDNNTIVNNTCNDNNRGIRIEISYYNTIEGNICDGNGDGIYLMGAEWCQVSRNWINDSAWNGIHFEAADFSSILNNTCLFNEEAGIRYAFSHAGPVANNTCRNNTLWGICIWESSSVVTNNTFVNNDYGIYIAPGPSDCILSWNILEANRVLNAENQGFSDWLEYNYWSDYAGNDSNNDGIGDTPHILPDAMDLFPLMYNPTPPVWIVSPEDITTEQQDELFLAYYQAFAHAPLTWWVSDGVHFTIDTTGHLISRYFLEAIPYDLRIVVSNIYGLAISSDFTIRVTEDIPPSWMLAPHSQTFEAHEALDYPIAAIDSSGIAAWELNNTIQFSLSESYYEGGSTARLTNASTLTSGTYALNISVFDTHGNKLSSVFTVTVNAPTVDSTSPAWVIASLREVIEFGEPFALLLGAWDESGIDHWWISDTANFNVDASGFVRNATLLEIGEYTLEVRAYDPYSNYCSAIISVIVVPPTEPIRPSFDVLDALAFATGIGVGGIVLLLIYLIFQKRYRT